MRTFRGVNNHGGSDGESWTMDHFLPTITRVRRLGRRLSFSVALCVCLERIAFCSVLSTRHTFTDHAASHCHHMNHISIRGQPLTLLFLTRVACMSLEVIRGATVRLPRVRRKVGYKIRRAMCLPFCCPISHHFFPYLHTIRGVCPMLSFFHRHDGGPQQVYQLIPIAQLPFSFLVSHFHCHPASR